MPSLSVHFCFIKLHLALKRKSLCLGVWKIGNYFFNVPGFSHSRNKVPSLPWAQVSPQPSLGWVSEWHWLLLPHHRRKKKGPLHRAQDWSVWGHATLIESCLPVTLWTVSSTGPGSWVAGVSCIPLQASCQPASVHLNMPGCWRVENKQPTGTDGEPDMGQIWGGKFGSYLSKSI